MWNTIIYTLHKKDYQGVGIKAAEMWAGHVVFMGETKHAKFSTENMQERDHSGDLGVG